VRRIPVVALDGAMDVAAARDRLKRYEPEDELAAVVRFVRDLAVEWHLFRADRLARRLVDEADSRALSAALGLASGRPLDTRDLEVEGASGGDDDFFGLLLDDGWPLALVEPEWEEAAVESSARDDKPPPEPPPDDDLPPPTLPPPPRREITTGPLPASGGGPALSGREDDETWSPSVAGPQPAEPPPRARPRLDAPRQVLPGAELTLSAGLAPVAGAAADPRAFELSVEADGHSFALDLQLVADGFAAPGGWRATLTGSSDDLTAAAHDFRLVAPRLVDREAAVFELAVHYSHRGLPLGTGRRRVLVAAAGDPGALREAAEALTADEEAVALGTSPGDPPPDLTVRLDKADGNVASGDFRMSFESPWPLDLPAEPLAVPLGHDAATFARMVMQEVRANAGGPLLDDVLAGVGETIADLLPDELWHALRQVAAALAAGGEARPPAVLLLSAESHVPWELAAMPEPLADPRAAPFLAAQASVGRWILGRRRPPMPPEGEVEVRQMAVVVGDYAGSMRFRELPEATAEGDELERTYRAHRLAGEVAQVDHLLAARLDELGAPAAGCEAVHFACHGKADPTHGELAAVVLDAAGRTLTPLAVNASRLGREHRPFVFLNACSVGTAVEMLDETAGFPGAFLKSGCRAFLAPLWEVDDAVARRIALRLYADAFAGRPVADVLREERAGVDLGAGAVPAATSLAYVFYGHPRLRLRRAAAAAQPREEP
jgi:hypothetical protein